MYALMPANADNTSCVGIMLSFAAMASVQFCPRTLLQYKNIL